MVAATVRRIHCRNTWIAVALGLGWLGHIDTPQGPGDNKDMRHLGIIAVLALPAAAAAHEKNEPAAQKEAAAEEIEDIEEVEVTEARAVDLDVATLFSRLHPSLVHFPVGWLFLLLAFDLGTFALNREGLARAGFVTLWAAALVFAPAMATGLVYLSLETEADEIAAIVRHRNVILAAFGVLVAALALRAVRRNQLIGKVRWIYLGLVVVAVLLVSVGGHLGGEVVHGEDYLPW